MRKILALFAITSAVFALLGLPARAQPNSPSGNQPTNESDQTPSQGGPSNSVPTNAGGDDSTGNRTTPGGAGATGGGAGTGTNDEGSGGKGLIAALVVLAIGCVVAFAVLSKRNQRANEQLEAARRS